MPIFEEEISSTIFGDSKFDLHMELICDSYDDDYKLILGFENHLPQKQNSSSSKLLRMRIQTNNWLSSSAYLWNLKKPCFLTWQLAQRQSFIQRDHHLPNFNQRSYLAKQQRYLGGCWCRLHFVDLSKSKRKCFFLPSLSVVQHCMSKLLLLFSKRRKHFYNVVNVVCLLCQGEIPTS